MQDLRSDIVDTYEALLSAKYGPLGSIVMFYGQRPGIGVSSIAASFAMMAAQFSKKPVWLMDMALTSNPLYSAFAGGKFRKFGYPNGPFYDVSLAQRPFFSIEKPQTHKSPTGHNRYITLQRIGRSELFVSKFRWELLEANQRVRVRRSPQYWAAARRATSWIVIDAGNIMTGKTPFTFCSETDACIQITTPERRYAQADVEAKTLIQAHGGQYGGYIINQIESEQNLFSQRV